MSFFILSQFGFLTFFSLVQKLKKKLLNSTKICPEKKIEVIPLGFDLERFNTDKDSKRKEFRKKWNLKENEIAIGIIGRLVPIKNHKFFIDAIQEVLKNINTEYMKRDIFGGANCIGRTNCNLNKLKDLENMLDMSKVTTTPDLTENTDEKILESANAKEKLCKVLNQLL